MGTVPTVLRVVLVHGAVDATVVAAPNLSPLHQSLIRRGGHEFEWVPCSQYLWPFIWAEIRVYGGKRDGRVGA